MDFQIKPIKAWPEGRKENANPKNSLFKKGWADTKKILEDELWKADYIGTPILRMWVEPEQLLKDGSMLRAHHQPHKPGVILTFTRVVKRYRDQTTGATKEVTKTVSYPCDAFTTWQDNARAIALSLQRLRSVEQYGVFQFGDVIDRLSLPDGGITAPEKARQSAEFLCQVAKNGIQPESALKDFAVAETLYKKARTNAHPDAGGSNDAFIQVQEAWKDLQDYHKTVI